MKSLLAHTLVLCAVSVTLPMAESVDARSARGAGGMGHAPVVSYRGSAGHRRGFRGGVTLPSKFRGGVTLPRDFRGGVTLSQASRAGISRQKSRVRRRATVRAHESKHRRGGSSSRSHSATKRYRGDGPHKAKRKRYEVVDWKAGERRYRHPKFATAADKHRGHERHRGEQRYRVEDWKAKKGHYKVKQRGKRRRHTHVTRIHHHGFSAGVFYAVPPTRVYVADAYQEYDDCRRLTERGHDASGRPAMVTWTMCFDEYGEPYVPEDGRPVITPY